MIKELLQPSIKPIEPLVEVGDPLFAELLDNAINVLIYSRIDDLSEDVLDALAHQFHIEGWELAQTEQEKRNLIKKAIEIHRYKGTPYAVKEAIKSVGYNDVKLIERLPEVKYDGQYNYSGSEDYAGGVRWALFRAIIDIGENKPISQAETQRLIALINEYKNVRSHLKDISYTASVEDVFSDLIDAIQTVLSTFVDDTYNWGLRYDGSINHNQAERFTYNGSKTHNSSKTYTEWTLTGKRYDNEWDILEAIFCKEFASDRVNIDGRYNGLLTYSGGFTHGSDYPFCVDGVTTIRLTKHIRHDGRYNYGGIYYNGSFKYDRSKTYFGGIYYQGNIVNEEALI
jgi:P2-related tail formation protein